MFRFPWPDRPIFFGKVKKKFRITRKEASNLVTPKLTATASFPSVFLNSCDIQGDVQAQFSAHKAALMTKTDLTFPAFSSRFVNFAIQFCF